MPIILKGVGYWGTGKAPERTGLPRPQTLTRPGWRIQDRVRIVTYLQGGVVCGGWAGLAHCRFTECDAALGSCDLTDGDWLWPQKLEHYVMAHEVCLPEAFIETMQRNGWQIPPALNADELLTALEETGHLPFGDLSYWRWWAGKFADEGTTED